MKTLIPDHVSERGLILQGTHWNMLIDTLDSLNDRISAFEESKEEPAFVGGFTAEEPVKRWCADYDKNYWCVSFNGEIDIEKETYQTVDTWRYRTGNYFPLTDAGKKQAEAYREKLLALGAQ